MSKKFETAGMFWKRRKKLNMRIIEETIIIIADLVTLLCCPLPLANTTPVKRNWKFVNMNVTAVGWLL